MASGLFSSIQLLSTKLLEAIRGTPSTSHQPDPSSPVTDQQKSVREDLEKLSRMLRRIQAVLKDAEEREIHDESVKLWLAELRGVGYQAEDVMDEFYYEVLRSIVKSGDDAIEAYHRDGGAKRKYAELYASSSHASYSFTNITKASIPDGMAEKIKGITERFEEISNDHMVLQLREEDGTRLVFSPQVRPPSSSHVDERAIFGREEEKEEIISLLDPSNGPDFMVLPIVGMGGFGKTTLAQLVFIDSRIHGLFNKRCWISVSEDFDLVRLTKAIVDSLSEKPCEFSDLNILQDILKEKIKGHDLFLVLDDVWNEKRNMWECFRVGLLGAKIVRIMMTTRNILAAKIMQTTSPFQLSSLPEKNCWSLFKHFAFGSRETSGNTNLHEIGRGIVKRCKGSPLAIRALGGILRYETDEEKWREILESDISEIDETGEVMPVLMLSYRKLPQHLKPCFLYLSMFPKGEQFGKNMVVRLWMAQGYINGNTRNLKTLEEIGSEYFNELQGRSLVNGGPSYYILHDLIHDLSRSISQEAYRPFLENGQECNGPCKVCHVYFTKLDELLGCFFVPNDYCSIRTFVKQYWSKENFDFSISYDFACVRALELRFSLFPSTLSTLKHLRYLSIGNSHMETLPETLCLLYNLQTLYLDCSELRELPESIKNLINLRHLSIGNCHMVKLPETLCLLYNLQTLNLNCSKLRELPENIKNLINLRHLSIGNNFQMEILPETLCLLYNLQTLDLKTSYLQKLPGNIKNLINLRYFRLTSDKIQQLPESICILRNLHTLSLKYCKKLKELPRGIEQLTRLWKLKLPESIYMPSGIGKLTTLKPLSGYFRVMNHDMNGGLGELKDMNKLGGLLCISGLNNISDVEYSRKANIASKPNLHELILNSEEDDSIWSCTYKGLLPLAVHSSKNARNENDGRVQDVVLQSHLHLTVSSSKNANNENDEKIQDVVLQSLQPHGNLTKLAILNYGGRIFPSWLLNPLLPKLATLTLNFWTEPNFLPPFDQLPLLRFLDISGNAGVRNVGDEPSTYSLLVEYDSFEQPKKPSYPSLEVLSLRNMLNLVEWQGHDGDFPCLKQLTIENCPKLSRSAIIPQEVKEVTFIHCPTLELLTCPSVLKNLTIHQCGIREIMFWSVCENLKISNCVDLLSINWIDGSLNFFEVVTSECCSKLKPPFRVKDVLHSMTQRAEIHDCPRLNLGKGYVYQRDPTIDGELTLYGNGEIHLSSISTIPLVDNSFALFLTKEDFLELESLTYAPSVGLSCQHISVPSLVKVNIRSCRKVISVKGLDNLSNLKYLRISYCPELCNWNDKTLPLSLEFLKLDSCDKLSSLPLLSIPNHSNTLKVLLIKKCPSLAVLEGFDGLMELKSVELVHCTNISISLAAESLQFRPHITIGDCPLMRNWCQRNNITYNEDWLIEQECSESVGQDLDYQAEDLFEEFIYNMFSPY